MKSPTAKTHGWARICSEMPLTIAASLPAKKDEPSQETPRIEMIAETPPFRIEPERAFSGSARNPMASTPAAASITTMMACPMPIRSCVVTPSRVAS